MKKSEDSLSRLAGELLDMRCRETDLQVRRAKERLRDWGSGRKAVGDAPRLFAPRNAMPPQHQADLRIGIESRQPGVDRDAVGGT